MITINYDEELESATLNVKGTSFYEVIDLCKQLHFFYNPDKKVWTASPSKMISSISKFEDIDTVYNPQPELLKEKATIPSETIFQRNIFDPFILKSPPISGKEGYENFQVDCIKKGISQNRLAFFLGMGTGKTYITIGVLNYLFKEKKISHVLVISPTEGIYNWKTELLQFNTFDLKAEEIYIANVKNREPFNTENIRVTVMSYRTFLMLNDDAHKKANPKSGSKNYRKSAIDFSSFGADSSKRVLICDESHKIKSMSARQTKVIHLNKDNFDYRYLLTGTPTPNSFDEIYPQMKLLDKSTVPDSYYDFVNEIANVGNRFSAYAINYFYEKKVKEYEKKFNPWVIRIKSEDAIELPELYIRKTNVEMSKIQEKIYQQLIDYMFLVVKENNNGRIEPRMVLNRFPYICQALDNPMLLNRDGSIKNQSLITLINKFKFKDHGKLEILDSMVTDLMNEGKKLVIFDYHPLTIDLLAEHYGKYNPLVIHGENTPAKISAPEFRSNILEKFKTSKDSNLLIASSIVLSTAVNIVQCHNVIYFSRNWNLVDWIQSQKRFHRIGQTKNVIVSPLIFLESLDERLDARLDQKKQLNDSIFQKEVLTKNEWKDIFLGKIS